MNLGPFTKPVEPYAPSEPIGECDPFPKTGVRQFRQWVLTTWEGRDGGIERACDIGDPSPHHEGRAWDWFPPDRATADGVIACLMANGHELARRAGLRNIIYWERTWNAGRTANGQTGWQTYRHADSPNDTKAHRDHIHFAFSWAGAEAKTSLYDVIPEVDPIRRPSLGQPSEAITQTMTPAVRTPLAFEDLRAALHEAHKMQLGVAPSENRLRLAWAMVTHETDQTRSMWNHNVGNIACTKDFPTCHALNVRDPASEPVHYRSYPDVLTGAADFWRLLDSRYPKALEAYDDGDVDRGALELKKKGYYGDHASTYARALKRHAAVYDTAFGKPARKPSVLPVLLVLAGVGVYWGTR